MAILFPAFGRRLPHARRKVAVTAVFIFDATVEAHEACYLISAQRRHFSAAPCRCRFMAAAIIDIMRSLWLADARAQLLFTRSKAAFSRHWPQHGVDELAF